MTFPSLRWMLILLAVVSARLSAVTVVAPNGGELLQIDDGKVSQTTQIQWSGVSGTNDVRIELSVDSGQTWQAIAALPATSQTSYTWDYAAQTVDGAPLRSYRARIRVIVNGSDIDAGNGDFAVFEEFEPNQSEERIFFLINRGRQDPVAEGTRYVPRSGGNILEGVTDKDADAYPQQPLIWNSRLTKTARLYSKWMWDHNLNLDHFHTTDLNGDSFNETNPGERLTACGYTWMGYQENISCYSGVYADMESFHRGFVDDGMIPGRGHRLNNLSMTPTRNMTLELGAGCYVGTGQNGAGWREFLTMDFGFSSSTRPSEQSGTKYVYIVGDVYDDADANSECGMTEGLGSVKIQAYSGTTPVGSSTYTRAAGGYQLRVDQANWGALTIKAIAGGLGGKQVIMNNVTAPVDYIADDKDASAPGANSTTADDVKYKGNVRLNFRLQDAVPLETIHVASPNGGEYLRGVQNVAWTASDPWPAPGTIDVELWNNGVLIATLASGVSKNATPFSFNTSTYADGTHYKIKLIPVGNTGRFDFSDADFTIDNTDPATSVPQQPADGATGVLSTISLRGSNGSDPISGLPSAGAYKIEIAEDASFTASVRDSGWINSPQWAPGSLSGLTTYFWRIYTVDRAGNEAISASRSFTTEFFNNIPVIAVTGTGITGASPAWKYTAVYGAPITTITVAATDADGVRDTLTLTVVDSGTGTYAGTPLTVTTSPAAGNSPVNLTLAGSPNAYGTIVYSITLTDGHANVSATLTISIPTTVTGTLDFSGYITDPTKIIATLYKDGAPVSSVTPVQLTGASSPGAYTFNNVLPGTDYTVVFSAPGATLSPYQTAAFSVAGPAVAPSLTATVAKAKAKKKNGCAFTENETGAPAAALMFAFLIAAISFRIAVKRQ